MAHTSVKAEGRVYFLTVQEIEWIEAAENYVILHAGGRQHMMREKITALEEQLDPRFFTRTHRSAIVNTSHVKEVRFTRYGDSVAVMQSGAAVRVSRSRRAALIAPGP